MAKPIKVTPVLRGNDAVNFLNKISERTHQTSVKARLQSIREDANKLKSLLKQS